MKYTNKIIAALAILAITPFTYAATLSVDSITATDANTLKVMLSENPNLAQGDIQGEITVMNDVGIRGAIKSETNDATVEIMLSEALLPNTSYSLLNISGANGSIDFVTPELVEGFTAENPNVSGDQNIASIEVVDDQTIFVNYVNSVSATGFGYKLLAESEVTSIAKENYDIPELTLTVEPPLASNKDYILMIIELQDVDGNYLEFDTGIYDFSTEEIVTASEDEVLLPEDEMLNTEEDMMNPEDMMNDLLMNPEDELLPEDEMNVEMNAAGDETVDESAEMQDEGNVEEVAAQMTETPDTGAETWVLILATLFINTSIYFARRKKAFA